MNYRNARAFAAGQARWDNAAPEDDGATECYECDGKGYLIEDGEEIECPHCNGTGWVDEDGNSVEAP